MNTPFNTRIEEATQNATSSNLESVGIPANGMAHFKPYDSQLTIPETAGTRIIKCLYQLNKKTGKKAGTNSYIRISCDHISEEEITAKLPELLPHLVSFLQGEEDKIIKELHRKGQTNLLLSTLSLDKIIESLEESDSGRLNGAAINEWFDSFVAPSLLSLLAAKLAISLDDANENELVKIETILNAYKNKFAMLASPKTRFIESDRASLSNCLEKVFPNDDNLIARKFTVRLVKMAEKKDEVLLSL